MSWNNNNNNNNNNNQFHNHNHNNKKRGKLDGNQSCGNRNVHQKTNNFTPLPLCKTCGKIIIVNVRRGLLVVLLADMVDTYTNADAIASTSSVVAGQTLLDPYEVYTLFDSGA